jgi:hypothetical protein
MIKEHKLVISSLPERIRKTKPYATLPLNFLGVTSGVSSENLFVTQMIVIDGCHLVAPCGCIMNVVETIAIRFQVQQHKQFIILR